MYPAPPVTRTLCPIPSLQTEQPLQGVEQPVPPAGPRRFLQGDGGLVEELVQQRLAEVFDLAAILGAQVREAAQGALELSGAHRLHPVAELAQDGHHRQAAVEQSTMSQSPKWSHASSSVSARAPSSSAIALARSYVRFATSVTRTPSDTRQVAASSAMSPAPRISAERPAS